MATTKHEAARDQRVTNQEALVRQLMNKTVKPKKIVIPGGHRLLEEITPETAPEAVYNWLRGCRFFKEVTVSLAKDPGEFRTKETQVVEFDMIGNLPAWSVPGSGKRMLAGEIAKALFGFKCVAVRADKHGVYVVKDEDDLFKPKDEEGNASEHWEPHIVFVPEKKAEYR